MLQHKNGARNTLNVSHKDNALVILSELSMQQKREKYPDVPVEWLPKAIYKDSKANGLTKCIIDFLTFSGWQAERINNTGRLFDRRQSYIDIIGRSKTIGGIEWVKGTGTDGTADISATIAGKSVKIEVKIGPDKQSEVQNKYQESIQRAGGIYVIAKTFQGFYNWYIKTFAL